MIDTIILTLPMHHFKVLNPALFQPDARWLYSAPYIPQVNWVCKCVQNATKEDERNHIYKPRLTFIRRWDGQKWVITLKVEFSIPKLIFWNNFDELSDDEFMYVIKTLNEKLISMGIEVIKGKLEQSIVTTIHYWKNIVLHDFTTVSRVLSLIAKTNISERFDTGQTDYQNGWELFRLHTKSFQIIIYDKIADLSKTQSRAVEKDSRAINYQMSLFENIQKNEVKNNKKGFEVLRLEIRFMNKQKLKSLFRDLKISMGEPFTLRDAFSMENARKIIQHHWNLLMIDLKMLEFLEMKSIDRWNMILQKAGNKTPTKILALAMLSELLANNDFRTVRRQFEARYSKRSLKRLYDEFSGIHSNSNCFTFIPIINEALKNYNPLKINKYMYTDVNNSKL